MRNITKCLLPLLFITYLGGITLFTHSHVVNGVIFAHSHPFAGEHEHSEAEAETIFFLSSFFSPSPTLFHEVVPAFFILLCILPVIPIQRIDCRTSHRCISLRAPPFSY